MSKQKIQSLKSGCLKWNWYSHIQSSKYLIIVQALLSEIHGVLPHQSHSLPGITRKTDFIIKETFKDINAI